MQVHCSLSLDLISLVQMGGLRPHPKHQKEVSGPQPTNPPRSVWKRSRVGRPGINRSLSIYTKDFTSYFNRMVCIAWEPLSDNILLFAKDANVRFRRNPNRVAVVLAIYFLCSGIRKTSMLFINPLPKFPTTWKVHAIHPVSLTCDYFPNHFPHKQNSILSRV